MYPLPKITRHIRLNNHRWRLNSPDLSTNLHTHLAALTYINQTHLGTFPVLGFLSIELLLPPSLQFRTSDDS
jgi:hypothetical protein